MTRPRLVPNHELDFGELPELTRALRALGSARRGGGPLQSRFFHALVGARRDAEHAATPAARVRAFDAADLARALDRSIERILGAWPDKRPAARRALRAELGERVQVYASALEQLSQQARAVLHATPAERVAAWQAWTAQLAGTFEAADRAWLAICPVIDSLPNDDRAP